LQARANDSITQSAAVPCDHARLIGDPGHDHPGNLSGISPEALDPLGIPEMMEAAGAESISDDAFSISTGIVIVGGMKRLMEVADQMQDDFQCDESFFGIGAGVGEFGGELTDLIDHASLRRAIRGNRAGW